MDQILIGAKLPVSKTSDGQTTWHQAEILSIRVVGETPQYYIHFDLYNKRLDEWVSLDRLDLTKMKPPSPKKKAGPTPKSKSKSHKTPQDKRRKRNLSVAFDDSVQSLISKGKGSAIEPEESQTSNQTTNTEQVFSKEKEIEKLRTSGSMTQSQAEISRLKNINRICVGRHIIDTWY